MTTRVRFAPSPTGYLHVGNIRPALINYLFAQKTGGEFILRIDDTDTQRSKEEYTTALKEDLAWLGLDYAFTFKQSERITRYDEIRDQLIASRHLYPCYETEEELDIRRKIQLSYGKPPIYTLPSPEELNRYADEGRKPHYRFRLPAIEVSWNDFIKGPMTFPKQTMSDPILVREDGSYLYTFTSVVDDVDYDITHIFRGQDHVSNTAVQICIFRAVCELVGKEFKIDFGHMSLLLGASGEALSKRDNSIGIRQLRDVHIHSMAITSYLFYLGSPFAIEPRYSMDDLIKQFDVKYYGGASPKFSVEELALLNGRLYHSAPYEWIKDGTTLTSEQWEIVRFNVEKPSDIKTWEHILSDTFTSSFFDKEYAAAILSLLPESLDWKTWFDAIKATTGRKGKEAVMPIRQMLTDEDHGPEMQVLLGLLGVAKIQKRLT